MKKNQGIKEMFASAIKEHQKNNLKTAEKFYKKILIEDPNHFDSIFLLGTLLFQNKKFDLAKQLSYYGKPSQEVKILDGLLIAVNSDLLIKNNLKFDERFSFHLYDVDFSRQAEKKVIKMGTIPMSVIHKSGGNYVSEEWKKSCDVYSKKWNK